MSYTITTRCIQCHNCAPVCPTGAIKQNKDGYWIDETLCNNCRGYYAEPQCVVSCPINSPIPKRAKKGRCKVDDRVATSPDLFPDGKTSPFASAIAIWELCNILAQRQTLTWETDDTDNLFYHRQVNRGRGRLVFGITDTLDPNLSTVLKGEPAQAAISALDIRSSCINLIFAAYATTLEKPWEEEFIVNDRQLENYLGLDKRKDLSKPTRLTLLKELVQQPCKIEVSIYWHQQGKVHGFAIEKTRLWHLVDIQHHFQEDELGHKHLAGLTFTIRTGEWAKYFLNKQGCKANTAFYQYGILPKSLLNMVMSIWQQREGAVRMLLWLLFKTKMGKEQRITVPTLMRVAYGGRKVTQASLYREERKRLLRTFEGDLEMLHHYGLKPVFDPVTYPPDIQPLWAKLVDLPDDAEEALEFWMNDGRSDMRLTDAAPRGKWNRLLNARLLCFELPDDWEQKPVKEEPKKARKTNRRTVPKVIPSLSSQEILAARKTLKLSQRSLADQIGKSQSWIRDVESGRLQANLKDQGLLRKVLGMA